MATCSGILAWRIPWTEPEGLQSMGSQSYTGLTLHRLGSLRYYLLLLRYKHVGYASPARKCSAELS